MNLYYTLNMMQRRQSTKYATLMNEMQKDELDFQVISQFQHYWDVQKRHNGVRVSARGASGFSICRSCCAIVFEGPVYLNCDRFVARCVRGLRKCA